MNKIVVFIGNIGSGKTTLVRGCGEEYSTSIVVFEPVEEWKKRKLLAAFYADICKDNSLELATAFQMCTFSSRTKHLVQAINKWRMVHPHKDSLIFMDAHMESDAAFRTCLRNGESVHISDAQNEMYEYVFENWQSLIPGNNEYYYIFLNTPPTVCFDHKENRIDEENRPEEKTGVSLAYLQQLDFQFKELYQVMRSKYKYVTMIDGNVDRKQLIENAQHWIEKWNVISPPHWSQIMNSSDFVNFCFALLAVAHMFLVLNFSLL